MKFLRNGLALDRQNPFFHSSERDYIEYDEPKSKRVGPVAPVTEEKKGTERFRSGRHHRGESSFQGWQESS